MKTHAISNSIFEEYRAEQKEKKADRLADAFASKLFLDQEITVRQANSVYVNVKKVLIDKIL